MCGIAGFFGNFQQDLLHKMNEVISHRGPDDSGYYYNCEKQIGLTHRRLSIIDLSPQGRQPMWDSTKTVLITFNGEIYNYRELKSDLVKDGFIFNSSSDTEVLLNLYIRDGKQMLSKLNGIFAFAIWDSRDNCLFIARDGIGVKPLYYSENSKGFMFSSELKALLKEESIDKTINPLAIQYNLIYLWNPAPHTMLKSINKLKAGHAMIVKDSRIDKEWKFYEIPYNQPIEDISESEAIIEVQKHIKQAVERQMVADVPVGAFLSGGLDSSSVVAFAKEFAKDNKLQCFTIGFKDESFIKEGSADDLPYAKKVAKHLNVDLHTIYVGHELVDNIEKMIYHLDEPQADPAPLNVLFISKLAREHGIKVLLSGAGGDDIFTGYRRHYALQQEKYWKWLPKNLRLSLSKISKFIPVKNSIGRRLGKAFNYAQLNGNENIASYFFWINPDLLSELYTNKIRRELNNQNPAKPLLQSLENLHDVSPLNKMLFLEAKHFLADHNLNYTDKMSMAQGVEVRVPLLDLELIKLACRLPIKFKQNGKTGKWIFKKAMEPYLPFDVIYRPKTGFGAPLRHWLKNELRYLVNDLLSSESLKNRGFFNYDGVNKLIEQDRNGRIDGAYTIFSLMCIELWCRIFLDKRI